jgi:hypothetical protein
MMSVQTTFRVDIGLVAVLLLVIAVQPAHAYIDPGSGGMLMQLLIGGILGGLVMLRSGWQRVRSWFHRGPSERRDGD